MRSILKLAGLVLGICCALLLVAGAFEYWSSCLKSSRDQATLDMVLSTSGIDQVEVVNDDEQKKTVLLGEQVQSALATFSRTNRIPWSGPMF
jgi:hypothetical protein